MKFSIEQVNNINQRLLKGQLVHALIQDFNKTGNVLYLDKAMQIQLSIKELEKVYEDNQSKSTI